MDDFSVQASSYVGTSHFPWIYITSEEIFVRGKYLIWVLDNFNYFIYLCRTIPKWANILCSVLPSLHLKGNFDHENTTISSWKNFQLKSNFLKINLVYSKYSLLLFINLIFLKVTFISSIYNLNVCHSWAHCFYNPLLQKDNKKAEVYRSAYISTCLDCHWINWVRFHTFKHWYQLLLY